MVCLVFWITVRLDLCSFYTGIQYSAGLEVQAGILVQDIISLVCRCLTRGVIIAILLSGATSTRRFNT